ncbi:ATP-dependent protease La [Halteromyces radiatus]|uniref:ATP-dependent protease La n=1 Tax=Halteromyces radiatus TaxID=101107 RepID=UPI00221E9E07|nr:ATP-dependent protease La [Halteromyces radiatus]KAI8096944.1 ATP-dependent protease La [Halteromyces radiatus]
MYPTTLTVIPLENKVLLPGVVMRIALRGQEATELMRRFFKKTEQQVIYVVCVPLQPSKITDIDDCTSQAPHVPISPQQPPSMTNNDQQDKLVSPVQQVRLPSFGCLAKIVRVQRAGVGVFGVYLEGIQRCQLVDTMIKKDEPLMYHVKYNQDITSSKDNRVVEGYQTLCKTFVHKMKELQMPDSLLLQLTKMTSTMAPLALADVLVSIIETTFDEKWTMLETLDPMQRLHLASSLMQRQLQVLSISQQVHSTIEGKLTKQQREFYLRQQLDAIRQELGQEQKDEDEMTELNRRLVEANMPSHAVVVAQRELKRIKRLQPSSTEWAVSRNYLEWMADMPWTKRTDDFVDIQRAKQQLDDDHFGLDHVKKRIIEYLSVIKIKGDLKAPIICFVGPPGVGKTSLGKSIAKALSREFHRLSLGGIRDEADMRGHRRTYVGSQPGLVIQGLHKVGVNNPLMLLDEIDKLVHSSHYGDPAAALLEILDPEQNNGFTDHYLNIPFDLSKVLFIATANNLDTIPEPLLDRMEIIHLHGYTFEEKLHIARTHLLPKQILAHGLDLKDVIISDQVILALAEHYTRESGVRNLERTIASIVRAKCVELAALREKSSPNNDQVVNKGYCPEVILEDLRTILGVYKFDKEVAEREDVPGVVTGLAYGGSGNGSILFVEATRMPGKGGNLQLTGSLGDVIKESAQIALSWVKAHAYTLNLTTTRRMNIVEHDDVHIHFPSGSIPKDGPSAGVTLVCALVSLFGEWQVSSTTAMTGEISLRGQVLPVGGIKEKVISAHRAGIRKVILPWRNKKDVDADVPVSVKMDIEFIYCKTIWDVLNAAFMKNNDKQKWSPTTRMTLESHL